MEGDVAAAPSITPRRWLILASAGLMVVTFAQRFGETIYLFRIDRVLDPIRMAARNLELWNPWWDMGSVQVQTVGYWLPIDLTFGVGAMLGIPTWVVERLFIGALFAIGLWGVVRLADVLRIGTPVTRLLAGFAYVLTSVIMTRIGQQSVWGMGAVFAPWTIVPLVNGARGGSPRRAAARSAVAIALMGGANAAVIFAVLPAPLLYLLTRQRGPRRASLIRWWVLAIVAAMAIWLPALYFFARYGPNILDYTETVATTVNPTGLVDVLRGTADWLGRLAIPTVALPSGNTLATRAVPIAATALIAAVGLGGLAGRRLPERRFLVGLLVIGVMAVGGAHGGLLGNPLTDAYRSLLDGTLGAFRNVYKFQPLVTLPLMLGVAHALTRASSSRWLIPRVRSTTAVAVAAAAVIAAAAMPLWTNTFTRGPGFSEIPPAWEDARQWLADRDDQGRVLALPGMGEAELSWGYLRQLPIQWGADITWATRHQAPLGGPGAIEVLDAVERAVVRGGDPSLAVFLRRAGFAHVLVTTDYDPPLFNAPDPLTITSALQRSGLSRVAGFGEDAYTDPVFGGGTLDEIEIFAVNDPARVTSYPLATTSWLSGDIESTLGLPAVLGDRAWILTGDPVPEGVDPDLWTITDGNQRYLTNFGSIRNNRTYVLAPDDPLPTDVPQARPRLDQRPGAGVTTQVIDGVTSIAASSTGPGFFSVLRPDHDPANVLDGDPETFWAAARRNVGTSVDWGGVDQWVEFRFSEPRQLDGLAIELLLGALRTDAPVEVVTDTDTRRQTTTLAATEEAQALNVASEPTSYLRVTLTRESFESGGEVLGIRELLVPGSPNRPRLVAPAELNDAFASEGATTPAWVLTRNRNEGRETRGSWRRQITVPRPANVGVAATGGLASNAAGLELVNTTPSLVIEASSTLFDLPVAAARNLVDGDPTTAWVASQSLSSALDSETLTLQWSGERVIDELRLGLSPTTFATPIEVVVRSLDDPSALRSAPITADGTVRFDPLRTSGIELTLRYPPWNPDTPDLILGLTSLDVAGIEDLLPGPVDPMTPVIASCDDGPLLTVATTTLRLTGTTTLGTLLGGGRVALETCSDGPLAISAGDVRIDVTTASALTIDQLVLGDPPLVLTDGTALPIGRNVNEVSWGDGERTVNVADGEAGLLVVNEVFNKGWEARLGDRVLAPLRVDGWRQAFVLPAGEGGTVNLTYLPNRPFQVATWLGVALTLALFVMALTPGNGTSASSLGEGRWPRSVVWISATVGAVWTCGAGAVILGPLLWIGRWRRAALAATATLSFLVAGAWTVITKQFTPPGPWGTEGWPAMVAAVVALLAVVAGAVFPDSDQPTDDTGDASVHSKGIQS
jgi:arabinofuranan 3-O-arabinosyltransferase